MALCRWPPTARSRTGARASKTVTDGTGAFSDSAKAAWPTRRACQISRVNTLGSRESRPLTASTKTDRTAA